VCGGGATSENACRVLGAALTGGWSRAAMVGSPVLDAQPAAATTARQPAANRA
jgi:hypothetical protein